MATNVPFCATLFSSAKAEGGMRSASNRPMKKIARMAAYDRASVDGGLP